MLIQTINDILGIVNHGAFLHGKEIFYETQ